LIADANGDLFGTTAFGGTGIAGTVFELVNTGSGYTKRSFIASVFLREVGPRPA
jgi:hypothetical protein